MDNVSVFAGAATPVLIAQLKDLLQVDNNGNGLFNQGDGIRYQTTIKNIGTGTATSVQASLSTPPASTTMAGTVKTSASASNDTYTTSMNITVSGQNVLNNDFGMPTPSVVSFGPVYNPSAVAAGGSGTSDNGGTVTVNANGTFSYTPPTGFLGTDRFAYVATTGNAPNDGAIVSITVNSTPTAVADAYNVIGNVSITPNAAQGVLANDGGSGITVTAVFGNTLAVGVPTTTTNGGDLIVNADGSFTYNPPKGFTGTDDFFYTIGNGSGSSSATVTLNVSGMIWFVNAAAPAGGDGRLSAPYNSIASFQAVNDGTGSNPAADDNIFIYENATTYPSSAITLLQNQKLIGQDATQSLTTITGLTPAAYSTPLPVMNTGGSSTNLTNSATVVTLSLSGGNLIQGLTLSPTGGNAVFLPTGTATGNHTAKDLVISTSAAGVILNATSYSGTFNYTSGSISCTGSGNAIRINGGGVNLNCSVAITYTGGANVIDIANHTGTINFTGTINVTAGQGFFFSNADGTYNFTGTTTLNGGGAGIDITNFTGASEGTFVFGSGTSITNPSDGVIFIFGCAADVTYSGSFTKNNNAATGISITNNTGGTITINGSGTKSLSTSTATAINLQNNTGTTINFAGNNLSITTTTGAGFSATGGGTVSVAGTGNTIDVIVVGGGTALNVTNTTISATGLIFRSISSNSGSAPGIILNNTGTLGGLTVTGDGTNTTVGGNGSGGTISNKTGADGSTTTGIGIYLNNTRDVILRRLTINGTNQNFAIRGNSVVNFTLEYSTVVGANGTNSSTGFDESSISFTELTGNAAISGCLIIGGYTNNLRVKNNGGSLDFLTTNTTIGSTFAETSFELGDGIYIEPSSTAVINMVITGSTIRSAANNLIRYTHTGTGASSFTLQNSALSSNHGAMVSGANGVALLSGPGNTNFTITGNTFRNASGHAVYIEKNTLSAIGTIATVNFSNNTVGVAGVSNSGSRLGTCLAIGKYGYGTMNATITNNQLREYNTMGLYVETASVPSPPVANLNMLITGNTIKNPGTNSAVTGARYGLFCNVGVSGPDNHMVCSTIGGTGALRNDIQGSGSAGGFDFVVQNQQQTGFAIRGYTGLPGDAAAVINYVQSQNTFTTAPTGNAGTASTYGFINSPGGAACF